MAKTPRTSKEKQGVSRLMELAEPKKDQTRRRLPAVCAVLRRAVGSLFHDLRRDSGAACALCPGGGA
ncbi:hypothetical protein SDC9_70099 [bioreactor metagenome]|uniref:Uncharacterized protein n=1 Tax=bioreactor metagenome TaxID=1076179 RepID=A0A644Y500_9ZZZZ